MRLQVLFSELGQEERSSRDVEAGTTGNFDESSLLFRSAVRGLPGRPPPPPAPGQCPCACRAPLLTPAVSPASFIIRDLEKVLL